LIEGEMKDFIEFLVIRSNETLKSVNYEDLFDKFSNDYMIEVKTIHDENIPRRVAKFDRKAKLVQMNII